jgi:acetyl-CoA carboxylase biotin carboxyl carrier protein
VTLTARDVAEITRLLEESQFSELHLEHEGMKLTLRRSGAPPAAAIDAAPAAEAGAQAAVPAVPQPGRSVTAAAQRGALHEVSAPLLGTFYRAPKPGAEPYVATGSAVQEDTIIGIIEVMKLMNTVRAGVTGTVAEILVIDGALVEYGQALLRVSRGAA